MKHLPLIIAATIYFICIVIFFIVATNITGTIGSLAFVLNLLSIIFTIIYTVVKLIIIPKLKKKEIDSYPYNILMFSFIFFLFSTATYFALMS